MMSLIVTSAVVKGIMIIFQPWNCMHDGKSHGKMHPMSSVCFSQLLSAVGYMIEFDSMAHNVLK